MSCGRLGQVFGFVIASALCACGGDDGTGQSESSAGSAGWGGFAASTAGGNAGTGGAGGAAIGQGGSASAGVGGSAGTAPGTGGAGFGGAGAGGSPGGFGGTSAGGTGPVSACPSAPLAPGDHVQQLDFGGVVRDFDLHVPAGYDPSRPTPLVFYLHPLLMNKDYLKNAGGIAKSDAAGFLAVFPNGIESSWNAGACCGPANGAGNIAAVDDVGYIRAVLARVKSMACVDDKRVYATGFSNGGFLSHRLACEASDIFAAVAPVAGVLGLAPAQCNPGRPVPVLQLHGTTDNLVPYQGGFSMPGVTNGSFISVPQTMQAWAATNGCTGAPQATFVNGAAHCESYAQCAGGAEVTLCTLEGAGHCWFGEPLCVLGTNSTDIRATDATWDFLSRFSLP